METFNRRDGCIAPTVVFRLDQREQKGEKEMEKKRRDKRGKKESLVGDEVAKGRAGRIKGERRKVCLCMFNRARVFRLERAHGTREDLLGHRMENTVGNSAARRSARFAGRYVIFSLALPYSSGFPHLARHPP